MRVFLTGASGFVGWHVLQALLARGDRVRCLVREPSRGLLAGQPVEPVVGDLSDRRLLARAVDGVRQVYHCAADYRLWVPDPAAMHATNVDGTRNVLQACADAGVERVVYTSTVGTLGRCADGRPADERTPVSIESMTGPYKRTKFLAERVAEGFAAGGLPLVVVNPSTPVGERDVKPTDSGKLIVDFLRGRMPAYVDTGLNLIDVRDVAAGHLLAAERGRIGEKYILGHRNLSLVAILRLLAGITGRPAPRLRLPHWVPLTVAALDSGWARVTRRRPRIALDAVKLARHPMYFESSKAVRELELPQTPLVEALARAIEWFEAEGYVPGRAA